MIEVRRLPARSEPGYRELIDSYIDREAHRWKTSRLQYLHRLGFTREETQKDTLTLGVGLTEEQAMNLSRALALPTSTLHDMTMQAYHLRALQVSDDLTQVTGKLWGQSGHIRYCPRCLIVTGGQWQTGWRLAWEFACLRHRILLRDACSDCGKLVPPVPSLPSKSRAPWSCPSTYKPAPAGQNVHCGADLRSAWVEELPAEHPILRAQSQILALIEGGSTNEEVWEYIQDLRAIAVGLEHLDTSLLVALEAEVEPAELQALRPQSARIGTSAPTDSLWMAAVSTYSVRAMTGGGTEPRRELLEPIINHLRGMSREATPSAVFTTLGDMSERLRGAFTRGLDPTLSWLDRLRFYSCTIDPLRRSLDDAEIEQRARWIPELLWPNWSIALSAPYDRHADLYRGALSAALLLPGSRTRVVFDLHSRLGGRRQRLMRPYFFDGDDEATRSRLEALCNLADYLDFHPPPIDYERRRMLDYSDLLSEAQWAPIARDEGLNNQGPVGYGTDFVRSYLYERITGSSTVLERNLLKLPDGYIASRLLRLSREAQTLLDELGAEFLARSGILDEPVVWQPPLSLVPGDLGWIASVPDRTTEALWAAAAEGLSMQTVAHDLDLTPTQAALILDLNRPPRARLSDLRQGRKLAGWEHDYGR